MSEVVGWIGNVAFVAYAYLLGSRRPALRRWSLWGSFGGNTFYLAQAVIDTNVSLGALSVAMAALNVRAFLRW